MASNIVSETIDATYPVAGVDNDTQGFRDNFSVIKDNFTAAKTEIEDLQDNTVKLNAANNFNGTYIIDANLQTVTQKYFTLGTDVTTDINVSFENGHYQTITVGTEGTEITFTLADWPLPASSGGGNEDRLAKMTLEIYASENYVVSETVTISIELEGSGTLRTNGGWDTISLSKSAQKTSPIIVEFWTYDGGSNVYANQLGVFS
jgi:hypothetical protein